ncbi:androglobin-like isoform X8 [Pecten maximus]|uniref:androglobin-like isoform X8 n=1 Tax=Pecten maximus TaxID=6579 RepID=UPI00145827C5|nr:androglobin-like isoform X8 [Pecten maximus]
MSRRNSLLPGNAGKKTGDHLKKRVSLKDGTLTGPSMRVSGSLGDIREGDTYYRTVHIYPSLPDSPEEVTVTVSKIGREPRTGSSADKAESRRGSVLSDRTASPGPVDSPMYGERAASIAASAGGADSKRPKLVIWPEWSEVDVNAEKWDVAHKGGAKDKGKSPVATHLYEDPDGRIDMPPSLKPHYWKRPCDYITEKTPVVVDQDCLGDFDLIKANEHLHHSELMRFIISQITFLWETSAVQNPPPEQADPSVPYEEISHSWRPWEHIYAVNKVVKGPHIPPYNSYGKYAVRLYWMGVWRKILIDDQIPVDENENLLLPATTNQHELWPLLLTKALIKVASLDYTGGSPSSEFGDCSIIQCLTGWIPESIPLQGFLATPLPPPVNPQGAGRASPLVSASQVLDKYFQLSSTPRSQEGSTTAPRVKSSKSTSHDLRYGHIKEVWELLKGSLPEWKLPLQEWEKALLEQQEAEKKEESAPSETAKDDKSEKDQSASKEGKAEKADSKSGKDGGKDKGKDAKDKDKGGKDKDKGGKDKDKGGKDKEKSTLEDIPIPEKPEVVVFATYWSTPKYPVKVSVLGEMADASEKLRQNGLSHLYPHPVCITQTRSCPLEPPPPPEKIPAWKLIRPKKKKKTPSDEPVSTPEPPKPIQCIEITSSFLNYKVSPVPIPTETHRPRSSLERGGTRSRPKSTSIEETDENAPDTVKIEGEVVNEPPQAEETVEQPAEPEKDGKPEIKPSSPGPRTGRRKSSATKKDAKEIQEGGKMMSRESSPKIPRKSGSADRSTKPDRGKSAGRSDSRSSKKEQDDKDKLKGALQQADSGLAPPPPPTEPEEPVLDGEEGQEQPVTEEGKAEEEEAKPRKVWMDFEEFCKCFKTLYICHKPQTYGCNQKFSDLKKLEKIYNIQSVTASTAPTGKGDKKSAPNTAGVNTSSSKTAQTPTHMQAPSPTNTLSTSGSDDKSPHYLYVDSLKPTEIVVNFSSLSRWHDPPPTPMEEKKSHTSVKGGKGGDKDPEKELTNITSSSVMEEDLVYLNEGSVVGMETKVPPVVHPGSLIAEPYSWKSLVTGQPILRLRSTATRAAVLNLPAGRHVLRFQMTAPLGHHVHLCSTTPFVFGDEETVMAQLTKESCRFVDNATQVMNSIGKCIAYYNDRDAFKQAWEELVNYHCPYRHDKLMSKANHFKIFNDALYNTLRKCLSDIANQDLAFAWRSFTFDSTTKNILGLPSSSRPATGMTSHRGSAKPSKDQGKDKDKDKKRVAQQEVKPQGEADKVENPWANREPTTEEQVAAIKIQKVGKGYVVRKLLNARTPGTEENTRAMEALQKSWAILEQNIEQNGLYLFRYMFKLDPDIMSKYPFYQDEWNKISYADYTGQYPDQPANNWFVVFREIFYVQEEMLVVPKLYVPINTCMLRVINNDTGEEIPKVFQRVAPYVYKKNRKGYTFVAEARTTEMPLAANKWRMRLIGSLSPLPAPQKNEKNEVTCNSTFHVRELKDYYIPNPKDVIFRYAVKVNEDHMPPNVTSIQVNTSKQDVYIKLVVLDDEVEVASTTGKGHAVIPAFIFQKDIDLNSEDKRPSSRTSNKDTKGKASTAKLKRSGSAKSVDGRASRGSRHSDAGVSDGEIDEKDLKPHKYIIQATVMRNSWPLSESSWIFVQMLKDIEKNELKVSFKPPPNEDIANKDRPPSPPKQEKAPAASSSTQKGGKGGKTDKKGGKDKDKDQKGSRPPSQAFDMTKPHWTLRVVSDASSFEDIEVKKDTERADEIRAMKKAWENAEPGRAAKALQSRLKYLNTHLIKLHPDKDEEEVKEGEDKPESEAEIPPPQTPLSMHEDKEEILTLEPPPPPTPKEILPPLDITPFLRKANGEPRYLDEEEIQRREEENKQQVEEYKAFREQVKNWREQDKQMRNNIKIKQLEQCEDLQAMLDTAREGINKPREAFRQKFLDEERKKQEAEAEKEAALAAEVTSKSPKGRNKSAKGAKSPGGGKKKK